MPTSHDPDRSGNEATASQPVARAGAFVLRQAFATSPRAYFVVVLVLGLLFAVTAVVAARFHAERDALAHEHFARGQALVRTGDHAAAIGWFRAALALDRSNTGTQLALSIALLAEGRPREAGAYLTTVLQRDPTSGLANLTQARISRALQVPEDAERHYRRAIYGEWAAASSARRLDVQFELAEFLAARGVPARALGELNAIEAEGVTDLEVARRLGALYLQVGAPEPAARMLRLVVDRRPADGEAWTWLSDVEFQQRHYAAAMTAAERALAIAPDPHLTELAQTARTVLDLDPTTRRLPSTERERRARALLERALALLDRCLDPAEGAASAEVTEARDAALALLGTRPIRRAAAADTALDQTGTIWRLAVGTCPDVREADPIMARVMDLVAEREATP